MNHSNSVLNPCLEKVGKTNSVSSLSVGVQYDLRDVVSEEHLDGHHHHHSNHHRESLRGHNNHNSNRRLPQTTSFHTHHNPRYTATAVEYIPSNGLRGSAHSRKNNFHHVSAPDFQRYSAATISDQATNAAHNPRHHHRHHHVHHIHHKSSAQGGSRTLQRNYEPYYGFGSLGRAGTYRSTANPINTQVALNHGNLSESDPEVTQVGQASSSNWTNHELHPPPVKTARLSIETPKRASTTTSRRYGSIRVAECSFVEAGGSQPSTPTSASICEVKHHPYTVGAYNRNQYFDDHPSLPPAPSPPIQSTSQTTNSTAQRLCNGPLSVGLAAAAASAAYATGSRGSNGQHSHIIPPPQNFCSNGADFGAAAHHPLTTTRIGSTINLATRMTDFYQHRQQQQSHQRSDSPPF